MLGDPRFHELLWTTVAWSAVWTVCLNAVPAGAKGRNHIVALNALHGVVCSLASVLTVRQGWDTTHSTAISVSYFVVDLVAMFKTDKIWTMPRLHQSRKMDYVHHFLGIFWGTVFYLHEATVCAASLGNPYVWIQTNEVSTPFYNWFRLTDNAFAGMLFALTFFLSRIVFNTLYLGPRLLRECDIRYLYGCLPFFALQYFWFAMIMKKIKRTLTNKPNKQE